MFTFQNFCSFASLVFALICLLGYCLKSKPNGMPIDWQDLKVGLYKIRDVSLSLNHQVSQMYIFDGVVAFWIQFPYVNKTCLEKVDCNRMLEVTKQSNGNNILCFKDREGENVFVS